MLALKDIAIKNSHRAKALRISVYSDGRVVVTKPPIAPSFLVRLFIKNKLPWIEEKLAYFQITTPYVPAKRISSQAHYSKHKETAHALVRARLQHFNTHYNLPFKSVSIKNQKTRWGSCSRKRNLNFNYKIVFLTPEQQDYIIVHELAHLQEFNHGAKFWALVSETIPEYKEIRKSIKKQNMKTLS